MNALISIVIPSYNTPLDYLEKLYRSLLNQTYQNFEVLIVDDCSQIKHYHILEDKRFKIIEGTKNSGPGICRNIGVEKAESPYIFFSDGDCEIAPETLERIMAIIEKEDAIMGNTITKAKSYFGRAVAYLGFPGGGLLGFDKVWKVDEKGYTNSISTCNLAIKKEVFLDVGMFDTSIQTAGGEDTVFGKMLIKKGYKIKYLPEQIVYHVERDSMKGFIKWQKVRGKGNYQIKKRIEKVNSFFKLRLWSYTNSIIKGGIKHLPLIILLIVTSIYYQTKGYHMAKKEDIEYG